MRLRPFATGIATLLAVLAVAPVTSTAADTDATVAATVTINPLSVELDLPPRSPFAGQRMKARGSVRNLGDSPVEDLVVTLFVSEPNITTIDGTVRDLGTLNGGQRAQTGWQLCGSQPGTYLLLARAEATLEGTEIVAHSPARQLTITNPLGPPGRSSTSCP